MFNCTVLLLLLLCNTYLIHTTSAAVTGPDSSFEQCFQQRQMGAIGSCLGHRALSFLQRFEETPNMTLFDGSLKVSRSDKDFEFGTQSRSLVNFLDLDPMDFRLADVNGYGFESLNNENFSFRAIFDGMSNVMAARSMKWELHGLYPGLQMRVGPYHGMNSVLEFILDPDHIEDEDGARKAFYPSANDRTFSVGKLSPMKLN